MYGSLGAFRVSSVKMSTYILRSFSFILFVYFLHLLDSQTDFIYLTSVTEHNFSVDLLSQLTEDNLNFLIPSIGDRIRFKRAIRVTIFLLHFITDKSEYILYLFVDVRA